MEPEEPFSWVPERKPARGAEQVEPTPSGLALSRNRGCLLPADLRGHANSLHSFLPDLDLQTQIKITALSPGISKTDPPPSASLLPQPLPGGRRPALCPHPTLRTSPCSGRGRGPRSSGQRSRAQLPQGQAESSHPPFSSEGRAVSARAGPQGTSCQCKSLRAPQGAGREGALEGLRKGPAAQLPCSPWGLRRSPSGRTSSRQGACLPH